MKATYGDVTAEYLALRRESGVVEAHEMVWVRGPDTIRFLDGLLSQALDSLPEGAVAPSLLLSPQGKLRAPHWVLRGVDEVGVVTDTGSGQIVIEDLSRFKIRVDVAISPEAEALVDLWGPGSPDVLAALDLPVPAGWQRIDGRLVVRLPFRNGGTLTRFVVGGVSSDELVAAGAVRAGSAAATAARIEQGEPVNLVDVDEKTIPEEANLVTGAVDFDKGCYLGQELVARIDSRGHVNRHLRGLELTANVLPPLRAAVEKDGKRVGLITSIAESLDLQAPVALGLLRREVAVGDTVDVVWEGGRSGAVVRSLPML